MIHDLRERIEELLQKINPLQGFVTAMIQQYGDSVIDHELVDYIEVKQQLLLSYCTNVVFYLYMKVQ